MAETQKDKQLKEEEKKNKELLKVLKGCLDASKEKLESLKTKVLTLVVGKEVVIEDEISRLEAYLSDLEQEYWDDRAVYAGRSVKDTSEYRLSQA